jgi:hypothetical protein
LIGPTNMIKAIFQIVKYTFGNLDVETFNSHNYPLSGNSSDQFLGSLFGLSFSGGKLSISLFKFISYNEPVGKPFSQFTYNLLRVNGTDFIKNNQPSVKTDQPPSK